ncbi:MAG: HAD hydrolase family protein [Candidatus Melainabacteria bacterium]|nr:HAD hydrolase family protein [Candidatus Melainabacteria bacterium]
MQTSELKQIIKNIKLLILDVDGVLTDGSLFYGKDGEALKRFNVRDGQGIKLAQAYSLEIGIISARECEIVKNRFNELGVKHIYQHCYDKAKKIKELSSELNIALENIAYIGDDILDVPPLEIVGLPICPKDAHPSALLKAKLITESKGGNGCVREIIDLVLKEQGKIQI